MRIDRLEVENFRCFEKASFEFAPHFNLLVGVNGSGKTSLLMAVGEVVGAAVKAICTSSRSFDDIGDVVWPKITESSIRCVPVITKGRVRFEQRLPARVQAHGTYRARDYYLPIENSQCRFEPEVFINTSAADTPPVAAFYTSERQWRLNAATPEAALTNKDSRLDAYNSWDNASLDMKALESWVITKSLERLEGIANGKAVQDANDELTLANIAISSAMEQAKGLRYDIKNRQMVLDWQNGDVTPFDLLSDGQNVICALVADIARRMCLLNPQLGADVLKETPGIVMIDELDMHLHPAWQRRIVHALKDTFPKVQFFAASHSPQIIGELPPEEILLLRDGKSLGHPARALGLDSGAVLEEVMGAEARNAQVAGELAAIRRALDDNQLGEARRLLDELTKRVGQIPEVVEGEAALDSLRWIAEDQA